ncbi:MAG: glycosyltransferase family protein [Magnetococcales bacterium]|nr:glycosyltransferase family protein [Magnetococcales bacterium]
MSSDDTNNLQKSLDIVTDLQKNGKDVEAIAQLDAIITQFSGHPHPYFLLGISLFNLKKYNKAIDLISRAVAIAPEIAEYHTYLGIALSKTGKKSLAKIRFKSAITLDPRQTDAAFHLGDILIDEGNPKEAIEYLQKAVEIKPDFVEMWNNLGLCHKAIKQLELAKKCFEKAIELNNNNADSHINLAMTLLIMGEYKKGWQEYEWRFKREESPLFCPPPDGVAKWRGEPLEGKNLIIICEQGFGDSLQFVRYIPILRKKCAKLLLITQNNLIPLLQSIPEIDLITNQNHNLGRIDYYCPLLSIPQILKTTLKTIPNKIPYIESIAELTNQWQPKFSQKKINVGLVWEGKPLFQNDPLRRRSTTLNDFAPLGNIENVEIFSLQKGPPAKQIESTPDNVDIVDLDQHINNFADTAAIIANLDIVITIDTATAHLSGAMGKATWVLLPFSPDWRWGLESDTTPWYPKSLMFRQITPNQWQEPISQMVSLLKKWPIK